MSDVPRAPKPRPLWIFGTVLCTIPLIASSAIDFSVAASALKGYSSSKSPDEPIPSIPCKWAPAIHLLTSLFIVSFIGSSSYAMQILCAPNRAQVDRAHEKGFHLNIGVMNVRNFCSIKPFPQMLLCLLGYSSICFLFICPSMFFETITLEGTEPVKCQIHYDLYLGLAASILVSLKALCIPVMHFYSWKYLREDAPLITVGDAIISFLNRPDRSTAGVGYISSKDLQEARQEARKQNIRRFDGRRTGLDWFRLFPAAPDTTSRSWGDAVSRRTRIVGNLLCIPLLVYGILIISKGTAHAGIRSLGIFTPGPVTTLLLSDRSHKYGPSSSGIIAGLPHLFLAAVYVAYNHALTSMLLAREWKSLPPSYSQLRLSHPTNGNPGTYYLQLPYRYSLPVLFTFMLLHWLLSQSIYVVRIVSKESPEADAHQFWTIGYTCGPLILTTIPVLALACGIWILSMRRLPDKHLPLSSNNSLVIAAAFNSLRVRESQQETTSSSGSMQDGEDSLVVR